MEKVKLGKTDLEVSRLAMGGLFISKAGGEFEQADAAIHKALELGINYIDTAPGYHNSEEVLGESLQNTDTPVILSTKLGGRPKPFEPQNKDQLRFSIEESLKLLKRDYIDILMIHEPDRPRQYDWWTNWEKVEGPVLEVIDEFKNKGIVKYSGLGGTTAYELAHLVRSGKFDVVLTAFNYSLLWREAEIEVIPAAQEMGMGIIAGSPLQQGALARRQDEEKINNSVWLSKPRREQYRALYKLLDECGMPIVEMAIRFVASNPAISVVLMGARSVEEVNANVEYIEKGPLPEDILKRLDEINAMVPFRPFCEPFGPAGVFSPGYKGPGSA